MTMLEQPGSCFPDTDGEAKPGPDTTYLVQSYMSIVTYALEKSNRGGQFVLDHGWYDKSVVDL